MRPVKLSKPLLIGDRHHEAGSVVLVTDAQADAMRRGGHAEDHDGSGQVANADTVNPLEEVITPYPPGGAVVNPADALAPNVQDNPGLAKLAEITGAKAKSRKAKGDAAKEADPSVGPDTTADEVETEAK